MGGKIICPSCSIAIIKNSGKEEAIAQAYSVSERTVYRLAQQKRETGSVALRTSQWGRKPALTEEDKRIRFCQPYTRGILS